MSKPTFAYHIEIVPTIVGTGEGRYEVVEPKMMQKVYGHKLDYKQMGDTLFLQIKNTNGDILYSAPAHTIKYVWTPTEESSGELVQLRKVDNGV